MATWERKIPSFHESSLWSLKPDTSSPAWAASADCTSASSMSDLPKPFLTRSSRQFSADHTSDAACHNESPFNLDTRPPADTKPIVDYSVTTSTTVATTVRGGSKSSGILSSSASVGGASAKVAKKRARASRKPPTTVLEADSSNFRAMVQQLTGIPSLPFLPSPHQRHGLEFLDLVRPSSKSLLGFGAQGLPPLDPSSLILERGQQLQSETNFTNPYFKYMSAQEHPRRPPSMGDFLRTPLDELGLDQNSTQQQQLLSTSEQQPEAPQRRQHMSGKLEPSMPLLWDGNENPPRDSLQLNEMSKYKSSRPEVGGDAADGISNQDGASSRMAHIVDSWLSQTDPGADNSRTDNLL